MLHESKIVQLENRYNVCKEWWYINIPWLTIVILQTSFFKITLFKNAFKEIILYPAEY